jgi:hypothetical protein
MSDPVVIYRREGSAGELIAFARPHLRASVSCNKSLFAEGVSVPDTLTLTAEGLREPISPHDVQAAKVARAHMLAENAHALALTYQRIATRHEARLARLRSER